MQERRRTNAERSRATRGALVGAARALFVAHGFAGTSTPRVAEAAGTTRGALYHHFADKRDLFRAVVAGEAEAVAAAVEAVPPRADPAAALAAGADAYLEAMSVPGRTRLLLVDAPAVLGRAEAAALDGRHARRTLREGLAAAGGSAGTGELLEVRTALLSAALDEAALLQESGADPAAVRAVVRGLLGVDAAG